MLLKEDFELAMAAVASIPDVHVLTQFLDGAEAVGFDGVDDCLFGHLEAATDDACVARRGHDFLAGK